MIEKILEHIAYWIKVCEIEINKAEAELDIEDIEFYKGRLVAYENTKKIVQEVAKEYEKRTCTNCKYEKRGAGLYPCSICNRMGIDVFKPKKAPYQKGE